MGQFNLEGEKLFNDKQFKIILSNINNLIYETNLIFDKDTISLQEMDGANVCMVILKYNMKTSITGTYTINLNEINKSLKLLDTGNLMINVIKNKLILKDNNQQISIDIFEPHKATTIPTLKYEYFFIINSKLFRNIINKAAQTADTLNFNKKGFKTENWKYDFPLFTDVSYSLEYLKKMILPNSSYDLKIEYAKDYPLRVTYLTNEFSLIYILAPRNDK